MNPAMWLLVSAVCIAGQPSSPSVVKGWSNTWEFVESWEGLSGQPEMVAYEVRLRSINGHLQAEIDIDGHMMLCRVLASVQATDGRLKFTFLRNRKEHMLPKFKPGDLLFELHKKNGRTLTHWGTLEPTFGEHQTPDVYFTPKQ